LDEQPSQLVAVGAILLGALLKGAGAVAEDLSAHGHELVVVPRRVLFRPGELFHRARPRRDRLGIERPQAGSALKRGPAAEPPGRLRSFAWVCAR
jgi:hypothetical protein